MGDHYLADNTGQPDNMGIYNRQLRSMIERLVVGTEQDTVTSSRGQ